MQQTITASQLVPFCILILASSGNSLGMQSKFSVLSYMTNFTVAEQACQDLGFDGLAILSTPEEYNYMLQLSAGVSPNHFIVLHNKLKSPVVDLTFVFADDNHDDDSASATAAVACVGNDDEDDDTAAVADISDNGTIDYDEDEAEITMMMLLIRMAILFPLNLTSYLVKNPFLLVPLNPQPQAEDVRVLSRYYAKHKSGVGYEKRVSFMHSEKFPALAVHEFKGCCPELKHHAYVRTKPQVIDKIKEEVIVKKVGEIYSSNEDILEGPSNRRQIYNIKARSQTKSQVIPKANFADQVSALEELQHTMPFVKLIVRQ
ncbi:hypothetical protein PoB_002088100 [Plakobranchus ocellatus]|uniref:C-type lectin domain-containing protein n=1 Tax=Plakobranchus ocellatus TaxID=259542 RepID=A0AAV3ZIC3_9GAST|nr:hypothetical protein PoB_002088100 [Plakobranchus ocellatus]